MRKRKQIAAAPSRDENTETPGVDFSRLSAKGLPSINLGELGVTRGEALKAAIEQDVPRHLVGTHTVFHRDEIWLKYKKPKTLERQ